MQPNILVVNPNTSGKMTQSIQKSASQAEQGCRVITRCAASGPETIETLLDSALSIPGMVETVLAETEQYDAIVSACFDDPGLEILRQVFTVPVLGIAESAFAMAATMPGRFSILITQKNSIDSTKAFVREKGYHDRLHEVVALGMAVEDVEKEDEEIREKIIAAGKNMICDDVPTLIMGCAGLGKFCDPIAAVTTGCCIDPVAAGVRLAACVARLKGPGRHTRPSCALKTLKGYPGLQSLYVKFKIEQTLTMEARSCPSN